MKIKNKLYLSICIIIGLVLIIVVTALILSNNLTKVNRTHELMHHIQKDMSELDIVAYEYLLYHEKRMKMQWDLKYNSLKELIGAEILEEEMKSIHSDLEILDSLFSQLVVNHDKIQQLIQNNAPQKRIDLNQMLDDRLIAELLIKSQSIMNTTSLKSEKVHLEAIKLQRIISKTTLLLIAFLAIITSILMLIIIRSITKPLKELTKGVEIIGRGNLEHKVKVYSKDELGSLATAFNKMTTDLIEITASRDDLNNEITTRKQAEEELQKLTNELEIKVKERTEELNGKIQQLDKSQEAMLFMVEDLNKTSKELKKANREIDDWNKKLEDKVLSRTQELNEEIAIRKQTEEELKKHQEHLEEMVEYRTGTLKKAQQSLALLLEDVNESRNELELANEQLAAVNDELEAFSYSVSHDLKAPLRAIDGFARIVMEDEYDKVSDEGKDALNIILNNTVKMSRLIDDLLKFSRMGKKKLRVSEISVFPLVKKVYKELLGLNSGRKVELKLEKLYNMWGDNSLITQVFSNLISNAIKYTQPRDEAIIEIGSRKESGKCVYYIKDNGVGFDMKYKDKLFGVFQRLHSPEDFKGTGIGLALVQRIINKHGGKVWAEAEVDKGATFYFSLPLSDKERR